MAKIIEFYVPTRFRTVKRVAAEERGKVIEFPAQTKKSALATSETMP